MLDKILLPFYKTPMAKEQREQSFQPEIETIGAWHVVMSNTLKKLKREQETTVPSVAKHDATPASLEFRQLLEQAMGLMEKNGQIGVHIELPPITDGLDEDSQEQLELLRLQAAMSTKTSSRSIDTPLIPLNPKGGNFGTLSPDIVLPSYHLPVVVQIKYQNCSNNDRAIPYLEIDIPESFKSLEARWEQEERDNEIDLAEEKIVMAEDIPTRWKIPMQYVKSISISAQSSHPFTETLKRSNLIATIAALHVLPPNAILRR